MNKRAYALGTLVVGLFASLLISSQGADVEEPHFPREIYGYRIERLTETLFWVVGLEQDTSHGKLGYGDALKRAVMYLVSAGFVPVNIVTVDYYNREASSHLAASVTKAMWVFVQPRPETPTAEYRGGRLLL